jgi:hypothetical protein
MTPRRTQTLTAKKEPLIDADALALANREWEDARTRLIPCGVLAPPNYRPGMPSAEIWCWHREQEAKIV